MNPSTTNEGITTDPADEIELKLEIDLEDISGLDECEALRGVTGHDRDQVGTYHDTPEHDLRAAGISLRIRRVGERHVQTIKAGGGKAAGMFARSEWEQEVPGPDLVIDSVSPLRKLMPADALEQLAPVFTVAVTRRTWLVERDGAVIEMVADKGVVTAADRNAAVSEIELELKKGDPAAVFAFARDLARAVPLRLGVLTKAERGYQLASGHEGAVKAEPLTLERDITVAQAFAAIVGTCLRHYRLNEEVLRREPRADALHQARVALRRLRSALSIFKPVVADARFQHFADELRWLAGSLGDARDLDVLIQRLGDAAGEDVAGARAQAYARALAALQSQRARDLMLDLVEWVALGDWRTRPADPTAVSGRADRFAAETLGKLRRRIKRRGRKLAEISDEERHRVRIQAKKLRYSTGFFGTLFTDKKKPRRRYKAFLEQLEALQEHLGELNDEATAPTLLTRFGLEAGPGLSEKRRRALLAQAAEARSTLLDAKAFW